MTIPTRQQHADLNHANGTVIGATELRERLIQAGIGPEFRELMDACVDEFRYEQTAACAPFFQHITEALPNAALPFNTPVPTYQVQLLAMAAAPASDAA